jgi:hypothetical protein
MTCLEAGENRSHREFRNPLRDEIVEKRGLDSHVDNRFHYFLRVAGWSDRFDFPWLPSLFSTSDGTRPDRSHTDLPLKV